MLRGFAKIKMTAWFKPLSNLIYDCISRGRYASQNPYVTNPWNAEPSGKLWKIRMSEGSAIICWWHLSSTKKVPREPLHVKTSGSSSLSLWWGMSRHVYLWCHWLIATKKWWRMGRGDIKVNKKNSVHADSNVELRSRIACSLLSGREHLFLKANLQLYHT